jgi:hypothetical protein
VEDSRTAYGTSSTSGFVDERFLMNHPGFTYHYEQGRLRSTVYHIGARLDPSPNDVEDFAIVLFFELPSGEVVRVAKVDNSAHAEGRIHVHRNYREVGRDIRDFDVDINDWVEAEDYLREHAHRMVRTYLENHGKAQREGRLS